jgi:hypothetical protein
VPSGSKLASKVYVLPFQYLIFPFSYPFFADFSPKHLRISKTACMSDDHFHTLAALYGDFQASAARTQQHVRNVARVPLATRFERQLYQISVLMDEILDEAKNGSV